MRVNDGISEESSQEQTSTPLFVGCACGWPPLSTVLGCQARHPVFWLADEGLPRFKR